MNSDRRCRRPKHLQRVFVAVGLASLCAMAGGQQRALKSAKPAPPTWEFRTSVDRMTDGRVCYARYGKLPDVVYTVGDVLVVNFHGRGGVDSFRYRIDQARPVEVSHPADDDEVAIGGADGSLLEGKVLLIDGYTVLKQRFDMTIDLVGLGAARAQMAAECRMYPLIKP